MGGGGELNKVRKFPDFIQNEKLLFDSFFALVFCTGFVGAFAVFAFFALVFRTGFVVALALVALFALVLGGGFVVALALLALFALVFGGTGFVVALALLALFALVFFTGFVIALAVLAFFALVFGGSGRSFCFGSGTLKVGTTQLEQSKQHGGTQYGFEHLLFPFCLDVAIS